MSTTSSKSPPKFARVVGSPGARVRLLGLLRTLWPLALIMTAIGYLIRAALPAPALSPTATGLLFLALAAGVAAVANHSRTRLQNYIKGARGEESVARSLALLPPQWHIFHGIAIGRELGGGGADIDHVAVGPTGVFVIETKNWSGAISAEHNTLLCDGVAPDRNPLEQVKTATAALRDRLRDTGETDDTPPLPVIPVLCFTGSTALNNITGLAGVIICTEDRLCGILQQHPETHLSSERCQRIIRLLTAAADQ